MGKKATRPAKEKEENGECCWPGSVRYDSFSSCTLMSMYEVYCRFTKPSVRGESGHKRSLARTSYACLYLDEQWLSGDGGIRRVHAVGPHKAHGIRSAQVCYGIPYPGIVATRPSWRWYLRTRLRANAPHCPACRSAFSPRTVGVRAPWAPGILI